MKIVSCIQKKASWKIVILLLFTSFILGTFIMTMFFGKLNLDTDAVMDSLNYYDSDIFFSNLEKQGNEGRISYLYLHVIDYLFISQFYTFFVFLIYMLSRKFLNSHKKIVYLCLSPFFSAAMDLLENVSIDMSLLLYPKKILMLGRISGIFTFLKMYSIYVVFFILIVLLLLHGLTAFRSRSTHRQ